MKKTDGGPAFPRPASEYTAGGTLPDGDIAVPATRGMSLRDYFAGQAIIGCGGWPGTGLGPGESFEQAAAFAFRVADAMLAAREKEADVGE